MHLTINNFFRYYIVNTCAAELTVKAKCTAKILSIVLGIFTLGLAQLICRLALYNRSFKILFNTPADITKVANKVFYPNATTIQKTASDSLSAINPSGNKTLAPIALPQIQPVNQAPNQLQPLPPLTYKIVHTFCNDHIFQHSSKYEMQFIQTTQKKTVLGVPIEDVSWYTFSDRNQIDCTKIRLPDNSSIVKRIPPFLAEEFKRKKLLFDKSIRLKAYLIDSSQETFLTIEAEVKTDLDNLKSEIPKLNQNLRKLSTDLIDLQDTHQELQDQYSKNNSKTTYNKLSEAQSAIDENQLNSEEINNKIKEIEINITTLEDFISNPNQPIPDFYRKQKEMELSTLQADYLEANLFIELFETFLKSKLLIDFINLELFCKEKHHGKPDLKAVPAYNIIPRLPKGISTFYPEFTSEKYHRLYYCAFNDSGTLSQWRNQSTESPIKVRGNISGTTDLEWNSSTITDAILKDLKDQNSSLINTIGNDALNILLFQYTKSDPDADHYYIPGSAIFFRINALSSDFDEARSTIQQQFIETSQEMTTLSQKLMAKNNQFLQSLA